jgi:hypothetical protein
VKAAVDATYRWSVLSRVIAAAVGGYAIVTLLQLAATIVLPVDPHHSLLFFSQTGYLYYTGIILWCFAARTATRAWVGLACVAAPLLLIDAAHLLHRGLP